MSPKIDFTGVKTGFDPLPEGIYEAVLSGWKFVEESKSSGKPYCQLEFDVTDPDGGNTRKAWMIKSLQPQSLWSLKRDLIKLGANEDDLDGELDLEEEILPALKGAACSLALTIDAEYDPEEPRNKVSKLMSEGVGSLLF